MMSIMTRPPLGISPCITLRVGAIAILCVGSVGAEGHQPPKSMGWPPRPARANGHMPMPPVTSCAQDSPTRGPYHGFFVRRLPRRRGRAAGGPNETDGATFGW